MKNIDPRQIYILLIPGNHFYPFFPKRVYWTDGRGKNLNLLRRHLKGRTN